MSIQTKYDLIRENVSFIFNDLALYNIWAGELSGQISDGKWENSHHKFERFWLPDAVYNPEAEDTGWSIKPFITVWGGNMAPSLKHEYESSVMPNPCAADLLSAEFNGEYFFILRCNALIAAALANVKVEYSTDLNLEYMFKHVISGKGFDQTIKEMREADEKNDSEYGAYNGLKRLHLSNEEIRNLWNTMHYYWVESLAVEKSFGPRSKGRKIALAYLKRLKEEMHKVSIAQAA